MTINTINTTRLYSNLRLGRKTTPNQIYLENSTIHSKLKI